MLIEPKTGKVNTTEERILSFLSLCIFPDHRVSLSGAHAMGAFLPSVDVMEDSLHLVIFDRTPIMRFSSYGRTPPFIYRFWENSSHCFLLFRMTHPFVGSSSLGGLLPCCIFVGDSPIWYSLRGLLSYSHILDNSSYSELCFFGRIPPFFCMPEEPPPFFKFIFIITSTKNEW